MNTLLNNAFKFNMNNNYANSPCLPPHWPGAKNANLATKFFHIIFTNKFEAHVHTLLQYSHLDILMYYFMSIFTGLKVLFA